MKKILTEKELRNIVRSYVNEAMQYDKGSRQYFPNYTGNPHSDAGRLAANNRFDYNYSRNDYKWSDAEKQKRFNKLQSENDLGPFIDDRDRENETNADNYLDDHAPDIVIEKISNNIRGEFENVIKDFIDKVRQQYQILHEYYYFCDFLDYLDDFFEHIHHEYQYHH